jgi:hypothetical protein
MDPLQNVVWQRCVVTFLLLCTLDDGRTRPKHVAILCFNILTGNIDI